MSREENVNLAKRENKHTRKMSQEEIVYVVKRVKQVTPSGSISYMNQITQGRCLERRMFTWPSWQKKRTNRFDDMVDLVERILRMCVDDSEELTCKEREFLSVAYRHVINSRLFSLRRISRMEQEERLGNAKHVSTCKEYKGMIESDLTKKCYGILNLLNSQASFTVARVFYWGKKGDYFKCLAEFKTGAEREEALQRSLSAYKAAEDTRKMSREENVNLAKQENKNTRRMCNEEIVNLVKWAKKKEVFVCLRLCSGYCDANWPTPPSNLPPRIGPEPTTTFSEALAMIGSDSLLDVVFGEPFNLGEESHEDNTLGEESYKDNTLIMQQ
ncbi:hypothetical protein OROGR_013979 [Orobanche gracilis]